MAKHKHALKKVPIRERGDKVYRIMDPVHNFIDISEYPVILQLIQTPHFQRLRRLYQLGLASQVYPGATHTRFAHSIGVMHVFLVLFDSITSRSRLSRQRIEKLRPVGAVAALLHDIGHGPFSHASEKFLEGGEFNHESLTQDIIRSEPIRSILRKNQIDPKTICDVLKYEVSGDLRIVSQLISSQLDADRLDYLTRDSFFSGSPFGRVDVYRIANTLEVWEGSAPKQFAGTVVVSNKGIDAIEDYILGRYLMYRGVYSHKASRCMEGILNSIFRRVTKVSKEIRDLKKIVDISSMTPETILRLDDHVCYSLFHKWSESDDQILRDLCARLLHRRLLNTSDTTPDKLADIGVRKVSEMPGAFPAQFPPEYYLIQDNESKSAYDPYTAEKIDDEHTAISHIMVSTDDGASLKELSEISVVVGALSKDRGIKKIRIFYPKEVSQRVKKALSTPIKYVAVGR